MEYQTYIVQEGDTIISIAEKFGKRIVDIIKENNLEDVYYLTPGDELKIPMKRSGFTYYTVKKGDNLYQIARKYNISLENLTAINGLENNEYIYPGQLLLVPEEGTLTYITKEGDTLINLAKELGISQDRLILYNDYIYLLPEQLIAYKIDKKEL